MRSKYWCVSHCRLDRCCSAANPRLPGPGVRPGRTTTSFISRRLTISPSSQTAVPAALCAPPRTDTSSRCLRAKSIAAMTSAAEAHRAIAEGRRSIPAFHTCRLFIEPPIAQALSASRPSPSDLVATICRHRQSTCDWCMSRLLLPGILSRRSEKPQVAS